MVRMLPVIEKKIDAITNVSREELINYPNTKDITINKKLEGLARFLMTKGKYPFYYSWPNALLAQSLEYSFRKTSAEEDLIALKEYFDMWISSGSKLHMLDYAMNGYSLIYLYQKSKNEKYLTLVHKIADYLFNHPKDNRGSLIYRPESGISERIFIDTLGMVCPFLCRYSDLTGEKKYAELAITQLLNFFNYGMDEASQLPYHGYRYENKEKLGIIGWGRAVGWQLIGLVDSLEYLNESNTNYKYLKAKLQKVVEEVSKYLKKDGAFSWQVTATSGPSDSSATSMIGYSIIKAINCKLINKKYIDVVEKNIIFLESVTENGYVYESSAECKGFSMYPQVYEWNPWSQGPTNSLFALYYEFSLDTIN